MKAVIQRVKQARVWVETEVYAEISTGLLIFLGVATPDTRKSAQQLAQKIVNLRIFADAAGKLNHSLLEQQAAGLAVGCLVVSQFTLLADCQKGRRPFFGGAKEPGEAERLYEGFQRSLKDYGALQVLSGKFGADMQIELCNDGPLTIILEEHG